MLRYALRDTVMLFHLILFDFFFLFVTHIFFFQCAHYFAKIRQFVCIVHAVMYAPHMNFLITRYVCSHIRVFASIKYTRALTLTHSISLCIPCMAEWRNSFLFLSSLPCRLLSGNGRINLSQNVNMNNLCAHFLISFCSNA